jgi:hypothetical protein
MRHTINDTRSRVTQDMLLVDDSRDYASSSAFYQQHESKQLWKLHDSESDRSRRGRNLWRRSEVSRLVIYCILLLDVKCSQAMS